MRNKINEYAAQGIAVPAPGQPQTPASMDTTNQIRQQKPQRQPIPSRGSTKPRHATKPTKIRDVNFTVPAPVHAAVFSRPAATKALCYTVNL